MVAAIYLFVHIVLALLNNNISCVALVLRAYCCGKLLPNETKYSIYVLKYISGKIMVTQLVLLGCRLGIKKLTKEKYN